MEVVLTIEDPGAMVEVSDQTAAVVVEVVLMIEGREASVGDLEAAISVEVTDSAHRAQVEVVVEVALAHVGQGETVVEVASEPEEVGVSATVQDHHMAAELDADSKLSISFYSFTN